MHFGPVMVFNPCLGLPTPSIGILPNICANFAGIRPEEEVEELTPFFIAGHVVLVIARCSVHRAAAA